MIRFGLKIIYILVFILLSFGFTVNKHFCGSELIDFTINSKARSCCDNNGPSGCCHNESELYQFDIELSAPVLVQVSSDENDNINVNFLATHFLIPEHTDHINNIDIPQHHPPEIQESLSFIQSYLC